MIFKHESYVFVEKLYQTIFLSNFPYKLIVSMEPLFESPNIRLFPALLTVTLICYCLLFPTCFK